MQRLLLGQVVSVIDLLFERESKASLKHIASRSGVRRPRRVRRPAP